MRISSLILLSCTVLLLACQAPVMPPAMAPAVPRPLQALNSSPTAPAALFPTTQGFFWDYAVTIAPVMDPQAEEYGSYTLQLEDVQPVSGATQLGLRAQSGFNNRYSFPTLVQGPQGVTLRDMTFLGIGSDEVRGLEIPFVPAQLTPGYRWESEHWIGKVKGRERVSVPAGSYDAWRIEVIGTFEQAYTAVGDYWLVEGLGVVKSRYTVPHMHVESVLRQAGPRR